MLGCQDFCGYYDWTFEHVRANLGDTAVHELWRDAIGGESQQAYSDAAARDGLRGLMRVWNQTGEDEHCDWTFTLDESKNVLRWDMRQCPSKGFLLENDLHACADYCDHCIGWIAPLLAKHGIEVAAHEHNHRGQCWAEMRVRGKAYESLDLPIDIRKDPRWRHGFVDRFEAGESVSADPPAPWRAVVTDAEYLRSARECDAVLLGDDEDLIGQFAGKWTSLADAQRPLLLHAFLPRQRDIDFLSLGLPRPEPILPLLIRAGVYRHTKGVTPSHDEFVRLLIQACQTRGIGNNR